MNYLIGIYFFSLLFTLAVMLTNIKSEGWVRANDLIALMVWSFTPVLNSLSPITYLIFCIEWLFRKVKSCTRE